MCGAVKKGATLLALVVALLWQGGCATNPVDTLVTPTPFHGALFEIARFADQVTGVAVSRQGRVFVNFPRWGKEPRSSVAELLPDGTLRPYPDVEWNRWGSDVAAHPEAHFICVQSVYVDGGDSLWILDPASPSFQGVVAGGAKLVKVNLATDTVERVIAFDGTVAPPASYLNDVRVGPAGDRAYITDSGSGAIVVVDLRSGTSRRLLADQPSTRAEPGVVPVIGGKELRDSAGQVPQIHSDGIALDNAGDYLYYHALTARTLYRIRTRHLNDPQLSAAELGRRVERVAATGPVDGMFMDRTNNLYLSLLEKNAIARYQPDGTLTTIVRDELIQWPDSLAMAPDGYLYFTASQIHLMPRFNNGTDRRVPPYRLFRVWPTTP
jgi:sugar lactone lactonase YvrE